MVQFLIKRFVGLFFVLLCVTFITFILGYLAPGDPIRNLLGDHFNPTTYFRLKHLYGLDLPWYQQYFNYVAQLLHWNFGLSYYYQGQNVMDYLGPGMPVSIELGFWGLVLTFVIGIPLGVFAALRANSWVDTSSMGVSLVLFALPDFVLAVLMQVVIIWLDKWIGVQWPVAGWGNAWQYSWSDIQYKLFPILVYAATGFAYIARLTRTTMLEVLQQDYVRTARAKGLRERTVIYRHAFRNAMLPLITVFGLSIATLVGGIFFIESIFNIPGVGQISLQAIDYRDYTMIQATGIIFAVAVVVGNLISDILYSIVDPRIQTE